jgi:hypothetical protein
LFCSRSARIPNVRYSPLLARRSAPESIHRPVLLAVDTAGNVYIRQAGVGVLTTAGAASKRSCRLPGSAGRAMD